MKILSLFSGVGGLDLAVETLLGAETSIMCERDEYARKVLARHWPSVPIIADVTEVGDVGADVICGGPPCQDVSVAGKQAAEKGTRWLWPEAVRVTRENRPMLCLWENVPGLLTADSGRAFAGVLRAFDAIGYATRWDHCEAAASGAPHRRDRVFLVCVPVAGFTRPGPVQSRPVSMFGHADEPEWPRAGWYAAGRWGVERARFPKGRAAVAWPTPKANDKTASDTMPQDVRDYREAKGCLDAVAQGVMTRNWPTPDAGAANLDESSESWHARIADAIGESGLWPTPRASEGEKGVGPLGSASHDHHVAHGYLNATIQEATKSTGALNPQFSEWLQGFAPGWTEPDGPALPHVAHGHHDVPLTYYGGRPAPAGMALLTTVKQDRRNRLRALGNAVVARCAILALGELIPTTELAYLRAFACLTVTPTAKDADQSGPSIALAEVE